MVDSNSLSGKTASNRTRDISGGIGQDSNLIFRDFTSLSRVQFLTKFLTPEFGQELAQILALPHRSSTIKQYQHCWSKFSAWLSSKGPHCVSKASVLEFLLHLTKELDLSPKTSLVYRNALKLPFAYALSISTDDPEFAMLTKHQFIEKPPPQKTVPQWELDKVLTLLESEPYEDSNPSFYTALEKALFLTAIASGARASELSALDRSCIKFSDNLYEIAIPVKKGFLFKNQTLERTPPTMKFSGLRSADLTPHNLCPLRAIKAWLKVSEKTNSNALFLSPTWKPMNASAISLNICRLIKKADPESMPKGHDTRKTASSLAWCRDIPIKDILGQAFWASPSTFINFYLHPRDLATRPCVALNSLPQGNFT